MNKKLIIFGSGDMADLAHYYFSNDSDYDVVAFTVDKEFKTTTTYLGLPVVEFESLEQHYPADEYSLFIALSYSKLNQVRRDRYETARSLGYKTPSYVSSMATVLNQDQIGDNCFILENNVTLWSGNHIGHHSVIADHAFIASHVVVSGGVSIGEQCFIGVNATLRDHIQIGDRSVIGAGALILKSCDAESLVIGSASSPDNRKSTSLKKI